MASLPPSLGPPPPSAQPAAGMHTGPGPVNGALKQCVTELQQVSTTIEPHVWPLAQVDVPQVTPTPEPLPLPEDPTPLEVPLPPSPSRRSTALLPQDAAAPATRVKIKSGTTWNVLMPG